MRSLLPNGTESILLKQAKFMKLEYLLAGYSMMDIELIQILKNASNQIA